MKSLYSPVMLTSILPLKRSLLSAMDFHFFFYMVQLNKMSPLRYLFMSNKNHTNSRTGRNIYGDKEQT